MARRAPGAEPGRAKPRRQGCGNPGEGPLVGLQGGLAHGDRKSSKEMVHSRRAIPGPRRLSEPAMLAGRSRGNPDGPVQEDPGLWRAGRCKTRGGRPGRQEASGRSSGCTVIRRCTAGSTLIRDSRHSGRWRAEDRSRCAAHVLTSAVPKAGAAALGERGGNGPLPVKAEIPPPVTGHPLTDHQQGWLHPDSVLLKFCWRLLHQAHPLGPQWVGPRKR